MAVAAVLSVRGRPVPERREAPRVPVGETDWEGAAVIRPGRPVALVDVSRLGARVRGVRLLPGLRAELQLRGPLGRRVLSAAVVRCAVCRLEPLEYDGGLAFDSPAVGLVPADAEARG